MQEIRTSTHGWLADLFKSYRQKQPVVLIDDAHIGIDPQSDTILTNGTESSSYRW
mgnify:CR=1 FL=1